MKEIIVTSQAELDAISTDFDGKIIIKFGTPYNRAVVNRAFKYSVVAWGNSSVVAWDNSSVEARGNSQIVDVYRRGNIETHGNSRIVYNPTNIEEYIDFHGVETEGDKVKLYKAVHFDGLRYYADADCRFTYIIGETVKPTNGFNDNPVDDCGAGIHMAHKAWAVDYGRGWKDLAILELEVDKADVLVPLYGSGKVRARKAKVLREVPLEECGLLGKMLAKQREAKK